MRFIWDFRIFGRQRLERLNRKLRRPDAGLKNVGLAFDYLNNYAEVAAWGILGVLWALGDLAGHPFGLTIDADKIVWDKVLCL